MNDDAIESLPTSVARLIHDDHLWFGESVSRELASSATFAELMAMAVHRKRLGPEETGVIDDIAVVLTAADPRIWPMKVIRVVASYGRALPAMAVGHLVLQTGLLGPSTSGEAARNLLGLDDSSDEVLRKGVIDLLARRRRLAGFGVAFRHDDERLTLLRACLERRGRTSLRYWSLSERMAQVVTELRGARPNIGLGTAAALLDAGLSPEAITMLTVGLSEHMRLANAVEGAAQAPEQLRELPACGVCYEVRGPRRSPRALAGNR